MVHVRVPREAVVSFLWSRETAALFELMVETDRARRERAKPSDENDTSDEDEGQEAGK